MAKTILVVDDDKNICELLDLYLSNEGFSLLFCHDGSAALSLMKEKSVDLVLLDLMLPQINGWEVCKMIRKNSDVPVIMLTARDLLEDKLQGFDAGADDYVVKPFQPKELISRINARLRNSVSYSAASPLNGSQQSQSAQQVSSQNSSQNQEGLLTAGNLSVDIIRYEVCNNGVLVDLKPKEVKLLHFLLYNKNIVFSREQLLDKVWNYEFMGDTRTVDVHIKSLREKLDDTGAPWCIKTVWGVGYKLEVK